eukprot:COSAG01_NODE_42988_length_434_cov_1.083582_1_plen_33_part_10
MSILYMATRFWILIQYDRLCGSRDSRLLDSACE